MSKDDIKKAVQEAVKAMPQREAIQRVRLFGSQLHGDARADSDVDLLVDFDDRAPIGLFELVRIQDMFAKALDRTVDVGTPDTLSKYIRDGVLAEAETLYER